MGTRGRAGVMLTTALLLVAGLGCRTEGPAERAGKKIDKTVEQTSEVIEETGRKVEEASQTAIEKAKEVGATIGEAAERTGERLQEMSE